MKNSKMANKNHMKNLKKRGKKSILKNKVLFETSIKFARQSLYKRCLPSTCIAFHSNLGKIYFKEALKENNLECYFMLSIHLKTQSEPAYCGISALCVILNALEVDPLCNWKGIWRFYSEDNLKCPYDLETIQYNGITLDQLSNIAKDNSLCEVKKCHTENIKKEEFIHDIKEISKQSKKVMLINFDRSVLGQTGSGHYCPVGGYNEKRNSVLLLDVARFKYPVYWVSLDLLWEAMQTVDYDTGKTRGYLIYSNPLQLTKNVLLLLFNCKNSVVTTVNDLISCVQEKLINNPSQIKDLKSFINVLTDSLANDLDLIKSRFKALKRSIFMPLYLASHETSNPLRKQYIETIHQLYEEIKNSSLYPLVIMSNNNNSHTKSLINDEKLNNNSNYSNKSLNIDFNVQNDNQNTTSIYSNSNNSNDVKLSDINFNDDTNYYLDLNHELVYFEILFIYILLPSIQYILQNTIQSLTSPNYQDYNEDIKYNDAYDNDINDDDSDEGLSIYKNILSSINNLVDEAEKTNVIKAETEFFKNNYKLILQ